MGECQTRHTHEAEPPSRITVGSMEAHDEWALGKW
jgi:hypothetical protein